MPNNMRIAARLAAQRPGPRTHRFNGIALLVHRIDGATTTRYAIQSCRHVQEGIHSLMILKMFPAFEVGIESKTVHCKTNSSRCGLR